MTENDRTVIANFEEKLHRLVIEYKQKEEKKVEEDAPIINKIEVTQKEITAPENYLEEEEFLKILKEFRNKMFDKT